MPSVQIKNVPEETHRMLRKRAGEAGQSLQEYLLARLTEDAAQPTLDEVLRRAGERAGGSVPLADSARAVRDERNARVIVVDASVVASALGDDGADGESARARLAGERLFAPELIDLEVTSVWRRAARAGGLGERRARQAFEDLADLPLARAPHRPLLGRI